MCGHHTRTVDLETLRSNVRLLRGAIPSSAAMMAVVKADGYGHGMIQTARAALSPVRTRWPSRWSRKARACEMRA